MATKSLVSVVITCYNYGKYLESSINSVISQSFSPYEIIVVDDGSTDNTQEVIRTFKNIPNIVSICQDNAGQARAKNIGIRKSSGDYVAFLDADDLWCPEKLEKQMALFNRNEVGVVFSGARYIDENGDELTDFKLSGRYLIPRTGRVTDFLIFDNFVPFSSSVVRRECLQQYGAFDESLKMGIDWDLWLKISTGYEFAFVDEPLFLYRMGHAGQMSNNLEERQKCSDRIMSRFLEDYPGKVSDSVIRDAVTYTHCSRGYYYSKRDINKSNSHYWIAIKNNPLQVNAYRGMLKNALTF